MCNAIRQFAPLLGRILLAAIFILSGFNKIGGFEQTVGYMASKGLPMAQVLLVLTIIVELGGGLMIAFGYYARWAAGIIFLFLIPVTFIFHPFWAEAANAQLDMIMFFKNLAIMGGMLYIVAYGPGPYSVRPGKSCN